MLALFNLEQLLENGGLFVLAAIVFAESGLLVGFFLPGDSLLFIAGFLASEAGKNVLPPIPLVIIVTVIAAIAGDQVGYWFGKKWGQHSLIDQSQNFSIHHTSCAPILSWRNTATEQSCWHDSCRSCVHLRPSWQVSEAWSTKHSSNTMCWAASAGVREFRSLAFCWDASMSSKITLRLPSLRWCLSLYCPWSLNTSAIGAVKTPQNKAHYRHAIPQSGLDPHTLTACRR